MAISTTGQSVLKTYQANIFIKDTLFHSLIHPTAASSSNSNKELRCGPKDLPNINVGHNENRATDKYANILKANNSCKDRNVNVNPIQMKKLTYVELFGRKRKRIV